MLLTICRILIVISVLYVFPVEADQNAKAGKTMQPNTSNTVQAPISKSKDEIVSEINEIAPRIKVLAEHTDAWNTWYIRLVGLTALVAVAMFFSQFMANSKQKELGKLQQRLLALKDGLLAAELAQKDFAIETAKSDASKESKRIEGEASEKIEKVKADAGTKIAELNRQAQELQSNNLKTQKELEQEKTKRLEMEKALVPREIPIEAHGPGLLIKGGRILGGTSNLDSLKPFSDLKIKIRYLPESEPSRAASEIEKALSAAGYTRFEREPRIDINTSFFDGVMIQANSGPSLKGLNLSDSNSIKAFEHAKRVAQRSQLAAITLWEFLDAYNWAVRTFPGGKDNIEPEELVITVGFKPNPYFEPDWVKELGMTKRTAMQLMKQSLQQQLNRPPEIIPDK